MIRLKFNKSYLQHTSVHMWPLPLPHVHIAPSRFCLFHAIFTPLPKIFTTSTPTKPHVLWYVPRRSGRFRRRWSIWFLYFDYVHSFHMNHFRHPIHHTLLSHFAMPWPVVMARFASPKHNPSCIVHVPPSFRPSPSSSNFLWSSFLLSSLSFLMLTSLDRVSLSWKSVTMCGSWGGTTGVLD